MIGIVLVSHSATLVDGVRELLAQMAPDVPVAVAGGGDDGGIGTSFDKITAAVDEADSGDGAVVLYDLGSAKLTTEMVLEMLDPERAEGVLLVDAPLVEGALAAATAVTPDTDVATVAAAARSAGGSPPEPGDPDARETGPAEADVERSVTVRNPLGLHARPAGAVVRALADLQADVRVTASAHPNGADGQSRSADARSMLALVGLGTTAGDEVTVSARGQDAQTAVDRIVTLIEDGFGEAGDAPADAPGDERAVARAGDESSDEVVAVAAGGMVSGQPAAPGGAMGPAVALVHPDPDLDGGPPDDVDAERRRLDDAISRARAELGSSGAGGRAPAGDREAIFAAHAELLADPALVDDARQAISADTNAEQAWWAAVSRQRQTLRDIGTELVAARAADVLDVGQRVLRALGVAAPEFVPPAGTVVLAADVTPSEVTRLHEAGAAAVVTSGGSPTAHAAIIARSLGLPMVTGVGGALAGVADGTTLLVDADAGQVTVSPDDESQQRFRARLEAAELHRRRLRAAASEPVVRRDGTRVRIGANVASAADARAAVEHGAEEVGLLRTEFWFTDRADLPTEDDQAAVLVEILDALDGRPAIVRTMDVGGDKRAPALGLDPVRNGFLGQRGIRWCLSRPDVFSPHLRAILRAAANHRVRIMFPFVTTVDEVRAAKAALQAAADSLAADGVEHGPCEQIGIMLEIPGAALRAGEFTDEVDFVSIGTNDLIQYLTAADRTVAEVAHLATPDDAALIDVVSGIVDQTAPAGVDVGVCGEVAADPEMAVRLLDAGVAELSMSPAAIPEVKERLRNAFGGSSAT